MQFGVFYEHQLPRPWDESDELRIIHEALEQVELADELGIDYAWEVEHHFLEEYSHSSAPGEFLAAAAARTEDIRLGHGVRLMPVDYNHPARVAEKLAMLDLISEGRVEWGTGESASRTEVEGFGLDPDEKNAQWEEATEQVANMLSMDPYPGYEGEHFEMPARNVVPKPLQDPHPPMWVACSTRSTIEEAAKRGLGALCFAFNDPGEAEEWVDVYYETFKEECVPLGRSVNPNIAMVTGFSCHEDHDIARDRGAEGFAFFQYALAHYYAMGIHEPGETSIWQEFQDNGGKEMFSEDISRAAIGTPDQIRERMRGFADAGVDQVIFIQQAGKNKHEHICHSLELFAEEVMGEFHAEDAERQATKAEELEPYVEEAMARKDEMEPISDDELPSILPLDRDLDPDDF